jgi:Transmembrane secretion effector
VVGRARIPRATSLIASTETVLAISAPAVGGLLIAVVVPVQALWIDAASFVLAAAALSRVRTGRRLDAQPRPVRPALWADIREGLVFIRRSRLISILTVAGFGVNLTGGAVMSLLIVYGVRHLGLAPTDPLLGALYSVGEVGSLAAAVLLPWLGRRHGAPRVSVGALSVNAVSLVGLVVAPNTPAAAVALLVWWGTWVLVDLNGITIRQQLTPARLQSRVNTSARTIAYGGQPVGAAVAAAASAVLPVESVFLVAAVGVVTAALIGWFSDLRRVNRAEFSRMLNQAPTPTTSSCRAVQHLSGRNQAQYLL